ncbi:CocE/NonD family hydrolase [Rhodococcus coprophilus]|uniref:Putative hydrolase n=1 Tax=Rhodococcus coprophilus TaxID=38310 RepID=A0A2X4UGW5_9NOCA|nr:CocE/NonD family hydrolase [Rhodococcus coprophilus]MBM7458329.1 putative CocE/NonD family hydrolase [Rhodococcus coprophilus]SQI32160.1 putative hydrolase [Rhodococcus coprophilus]
MVAVAIMAIAVVSAVPAGADPSGGSDAVAWQASVDAPDAYPGTAVEWDVPITLSDGTLLRANVFRPANADGSPIAEPTPVILNLTPYTKLLSTLASLLMEDPSLGPVVENLGTTLNLGVPFDGITELASPASQLGKAFGLNRDLVQNGYTQVVVDVRGTGFSHGQWQVLGPREQQDTVEVIDWAASQPWSNGRVGTTGVSYSAINQIQAAGLRPQALEAVFAVEPGNDLLRDIVGTGGALGIGFMPAWLGLVNGLKWLPDVQALLEGRFDARWLRDRLADPSTKIPELLEVITAPSVDSVSPGALEVAQDGAFYQDRQARLESVEVPTFVFGNWHDIFANSEPDIYNRIPVEPGRKQLVMGDGYHAVTGTGFGTPGFPPDIAALQRAWFDRWLRGIDNGIEKYGPVTLLQQGGGWTTTRQFPREGVRHEKLFLAAAPSGTAAHAAHDGTLVPTLPDEARRLTVSPGLRGFCSREGAQGTAGITVLLGSTCTKDSRFHEAEALTFTSEAFSEPTLFSGPFNVHLNTVLDATDGFWSVTVNDVGPDGRSTVLSTGSLVSSLRTIDDSLSSFTAEGDYASAHPTLTLATRKPVVPGESTLLDISTLPTEAVLAPGHRLRIDVYAANVPRSLPLGPMLNESGLRPQHLELDRSAPSFVTLPTVRGRTWEN